MGDHDEPGKGGAASAVSQFTWEKYLSLSHLSISGGRGEPFSFQRILKSKLTVLFPGTVSIKALTRYSDLSVKK